MSEPPRPGVTALDGYAATSESAFNAVAGIRRLCALLPVHALHRTEDDGLLPVASMWSRVEDMLAAIIRTDPRPNTWISLGLAEPGVVPDLDARQDVGVRLAHFRLDGPTLARRSLDSNPAQLLKVSADHVEECTKRVLDNEEHNPYGHAAYFGSRVPSQLRDWIMALPELCEDLPAKPTEFPRWQGETITAAQQIDLLETLILGARRSVLANAAIGTERMVGAFLLCRLERAIAPPNTISLEEIAEFGGTDADEDVAWAEVDLAAGTGQKEMNPIETAERRELEETLGDRVLVAVARLSPDTTTPELDRLHAACAAADTLGIKLRPGLERDIEKLITATVSNFSDNLTRPARDLPADQWFSDVPVVTRELPNGDGGMGL